MVPVTLRLHIFVQTSVYDGDSCGILSDAIGRTNVACCGLKSPFIYQKMIGAGNNLLIRVSVRHQATQRGLKTTVKLFQILFNFIRFVF